MSDSFLRVLHFIVMSQWSVSRAGPSCDRGVDPHTLPGVGVRTTKLRNRRSGRSPRSCRGRTVPTVLRARTSTRSVSPLEPATAVSVDVGLVVDP